MRAIARIALAVTVAIAALAGSSSAAQAQFGAGFGVRDGSLKAELSGPQAGQAGAQAEFTTSFTLRVVGEGTPEQGVLPDGTLRNIEVELPAGLVANPTHWEECTISRVVLASNRCSPNSAVGIVKFRIFNTITLTPYPLLFTSRLYRIKPQGEEAAAFGFNALNIPMRLHAKVDPSNGHRIRSLGIEFNETQPLLSAEVTLWGVPEDHQAALSIPNGGFNEVGAGTFGGPRPADVPRHRFLSVPARCDGAFETKITMRSWQRLVNDPPLFASTPAVSGCEQLQFEPSLTVAPDNAVAGQPSGYGVELSVPQNTDAYGLETPTLKKAVVSLPAGVAISPGQADGLQACSDEQFDAAGASAPACPPASKIASVNIDTPLLDDDVPGSLYIGTQQSNDPESGQMYRLLLSAHSPGARIKLRGSVRVDSATGRLTATFDDNPQLPFSKMTLAFKGGDRGVLANPAACSQYATDYALTAWSGHDKTTTSSPFAISDGCTTQNAFQPNVKAGLTNPVAASSSTFTFQLNRPDGQQNVTGVSVRLPKGLIGSLRGVAVCPEANAQAGSCPEATRVGHTTVAVGSGAKPLYVPQAGKSPTAVYLGGPYKGAPYSLVVKVPAEAGPFDLGDVVVRSALAVDAETAEVTVTTDPLPQIVGGVPMRYRTIHVNIDRAQFMRSPTSCAEKSIDTTIAGNPGTTVAVKTPFWVEGCSKLAFRPRLEMSLLGKRRTRTGRHPGLTAALTQGAGQANIDQARVTLPKSVVLDPNNSVDPKLVCSYDDGLEGNCPASSIIGKAAAWTSLLNKRLAGPVHLVQGIRFGPSGNRIRTTPALLVKLRGEVDINLRAATTVRRGRLVTTFKDVPDAPVTKFKMRIRGGKKGILVVTRTRKKKLNLCHTKQIARVELDGQNARTADFNKRVKTPCKKTKAGKRKTRKK